VPLTFFMTWNLQGLWVTLTAACALAAITGTKSPPLGPMDAIGISLWMAGLVIETVADEQKRAHRRRVGPGHFITTGLWAWSRHPNYLGEIMLWTGVALTALPALQSWQWVTLISPVFVAVLLTRISGVNLLEKKAIKKWGHEESYRAYIARTPRLLPWIGRRN
jgi:steroid 5-alpha reductase family enzyme